MLPWIALTAMRGGGKRRAGHALQAANEKIATLATAIASGRHILRCNASARYAPSAQSTSVMPYVPAYAAIARSGESACVYPSWSNGAASTPIDRNHSQNVNAAAAASGARLGFARSYAIADS